MEASDAIGLITGAASGIGAAAARTLAAAGADLALLDDQEEPDAARPITEAP